jgi:hypothetical protein
MGRNDKNRLRITLYREIMHIAEKTRDQSTPIRGTFWRAGRPLGILQYVTLRDVTAMFGNNRKITKIRNNF